MNNEETLLADLPQNTRGGDQNTIEWKTVRKLLEMAEKERKKKVDKCKEGEDLYAEQFDPSKKKGQRHLNGTLLFQVIGRVMRPMALPTARVRLMGGSRKLEQAVEDTLIQGIATTGLKDACLYQMGALHLALLFGDSFLKAGIKNDYKKGFPTIFQRADIQNVYIDPFAIEMRNLSSSKDADWWAYSDTYSWDEIIKVYPQIEDGAMVGMLPIKEDQWNDQLTYTEDQKREMKEREIECLYFYSRSLKKFFIFAGSNAFKVYEGEDGFELFHLLCFPSIKGFYNYGFIDLFTKYHNIFREITNRGISSLISNLNPTKILYAPRLNQKDIEHKLYKAAIDKARGGEGVISLDSSGNETVSLQSLVGQEMTGELERIYNQLEKEIKRMGINLDDIFFSGNQTLGQTEIAESNANEFIEERIDVNSQEIKRAYIKILEDIRDYVSPADDSRIESEVSDEVTLGGIRDILNAYEFDIEINLKSGAFPSFITRAKRNQELLTILSQVAPGTGAYKKALKEYASLRGANIDDESIALPQAPLAPQQ